MWGGVCVFCLFAESRTGDMYRFPEMQFYILWADPLQLSSSGSSGVTPDPASGKRVILYFISSPIKKQ